MASSLQFAVALLLGIVLPEAHAQAPAPAAVRPAKLGLCVACHGANGMATTQDAPHLAGQREPYLVAAMQAYRIGDRKHAAMQAVAGTLSAQDIAQQSRWYAGQRAGPSLSSTTGGSAR